MGVTEVMISIAKGGRGGGRHNMLTFDSPMKKSPVIGLVGYRYLGSVKLAVVNNRPIELQGKFLIQMKIIRGCNEDLVEMDRPLPDKR